LVQGFGRIKIFPENPFATPIRLSVVGRQRRQSLRAHEERRHQEADMTARTTFALVFWMAVAVEVTIPTIKLWASAPECQSKSAEPIAAWEIIYRPQHWNAY
jgi:hypothetical protein